MGRFVALRPRDIAEEGLRAHAAGNGNEPDGPISRVVKYVPTEIVSGYAVLSGLVQAIPVGTQRIILAWICFIAGLIVTPLYLRKLGPSPGQEPQVWIATVSFVLWAYLLGGPFALPPLESFYSAPIGSVLVGLYTWIVGLFYAPKEPAQVPATSTSSI